MCSTSTFHTSNTAAHTLRVLISFVSLVETFEIASHKCLVKFQPNNKQHVLANSFFLLSLYTTCCSLSTWLCDNKQRYTYLILIGYATNIKQSASTNRPTLAEPSPLSLSSVLTGSSLFLLTEDFSGSTRVGSRMSHMQTISCKKMELFKWKIYLWRRNDFFNDHEVGFYG